MTKYCPEGTILNNKTGRCNKKKTQRKRCPKGTKRNKKTGNCDGHGHVSIPEPVPEPTTKPQRKRCPKGTKRNKKTGNCDGPVVSSNTPTHKNSISHVMNEYMKQSTSDVFPYICNTSIQKLMLIHLLETNKTGCAYDVRKFGFVDVGNKMHIHKLNSKKGQVITSAFIKHIKQQYERCKSMGRLMVMPISIYNNEHANVIIFNPFRNEVERFEPHGANTHIDGFNDTKVNEQLQQFVDKLDIDSKFVPSHKTCPIGFKAYQYYDREKRQKGKFNNVSVLDPGGYCCAWSFFYSDLRLKYPRMSGADIIRKSIDIIGTNPKTFRSFIHGQVEYLHKLMKRINKYSKFEKYINWYYQKSDLKSRLTAETIQKGDLFDFHMMKIEWDKFVDKELVKYL